MSGKFVVMYQCKLGNTLMCFRKALNNYTILHEYLTQVRIVLEKIKNIENAMMNWLYRTNSINKCWQDLITSLILSSDYTS